MRRKMGHTHNLNQDLPADNRSIKLENVCHVCQNLYKRKSLPLNLNSGIATR